MTEQGIPFAPEYDPDTGSMLPCKHNMENLSWCDGEELLCSCGAEAKLDWNQTYLSLLKEAREAMADTLPLLNCSGLCDHKDPQAECNVHYRCEEAIDKIDSVLRETGQ